MIQSNRKHSNNSGKNTRKLLSFTAAVILLLSTTSNGLAQTEFEGSLKSVSITDAVGTNSAPTAIFTYTQDGDTFTFDASGSSDSDGTTTRYKWDFGDGTIVEGKTVQHTISNVPTPVTLTVVSGDGGIVIVQEMVAIQGFELIIDNADTAFTATEIWTTSTSTLGYYGRDYKVAAAGNGYTIASWETNIPTTGQYEIFCQYSAYGNRAKNAPYTVTNNSAIISTVLVNQQYNGGLFFSLGTFNLTKGNLQIALSNDANGYVVADAIKIKLTQ